MAEPLPTWRRVEPDVREQELSVDGWMRSGRDRWEEREGRSENEDG